MTLKNFFNFLKIITGFGTDILASQPRKDLIYVLHPRIMRYFLFQNVRKASGVDNSRGLFFIYVKRSLQFG